jgi:hypothetical protein
MKSLELMEVYSAKSIAERTGLTGLSVDRGCDCDNTADEELYLSILCRWVRT